MNCQQITNSLNEIKSKKTAFDVEFGQGNIDSSWQLKLDLSQMIKELRDKLWPFEILTKDELEQQYASQIEIFRKNGLTEALFSGAEGIIGINGKEYPIPDLETVIAELFEKQEDIALKIEQGICRLQIVPFAKPITELADSVGKSILAHKKAGKLFSDNGDALELDESTPIFVWDKYQDADKTGELVYYPKEYSQNHQGKTKSELLGEQSSTPGWQILLIEDQPIPKTDQGKTISGRPQLEAGQSPNDYLRVQQENPIYTNEVFHTPESWIAYFLTHLEETNQVIDDYSSGSIRYLGGAYFPSADSVSYGCWYRADPQAYLGRRDPTDVRAGCGAAAAVRIT